MIDGNQSSRFISLSDVHSGRLRSYRCSLIRDTCPRGSTNPFAFARCASSKKEVLRKPTCSYSVICVINSYVSWESENTTHISDTRRVPPTTPEDPRGGGQGPRWGDLVIRSWYLGDYAIGGSLQGRKHRSVLLSVSVLPGRSVTIQLFEMTLGAPRRGTPMRSTEEEDR